ncbi:MAG: hypothetical protein V2J12_12080 [Gammaproteobacteria bacterium]|jgi:hypothetical protein|nr:hypothetical protein [Gammaproteobacteria bacterium]
MRQVLLRYFAYALLVFGVMLSLLLIADRTASGLNFDAQLAGLNIQTSELSPVELLQHTLLLISAALFAMVGFRDPLRRPMAFTLSLVLAACFVRELDFFLDFYGMDNLWQVLCGVLIAANCVYGIRHRVGLVQGWRRSWPSAGLAMLLAGFIMLVPFAQMVGHEGLWRAILADDYLRVVKVVAEEFVELGAYLLITIGAIEFVYAWSRLPRRSRRQAEG